MNQSGAVYRDIPYSPSAGFSARGDLHLPMGSASGYPVLLIHGGGWKALTKESFEFMVPFFLQAGRPVFNIDYRLLGEDPWPACGDDCLAAGHYLLEGGLSSYGIPAAEKILICGASAGGHLAMMTGLRLPRESVEAVLSLAGPSRIDWVAETKDPIGLHVDFLPGFFGHPVDLDSPEVRSASPALLGVKNPPPLFCLQSRNDMLVPPSQTEEACRAWREAGGSAEASFLDGDGNLHGLWIEDDHDRLRPEVSQFVSHSLSQLP